jgi:methylglutaconyl-CoA hydratase
LTTSAQELVHCDVTGHRATVTLDSPAKRNAISATVVSQLNEALTSAIDNPEVRVIVLTGIGTTFCAGADLKEEVAEAGTGDPRAARAGALFTRMLRCPKPIVARVNGHARAAGVGLIGACDIAVALEAATFAINEVRVGLLPATVAVPLRTRMSAGSLRRYSLTGEVFSAADGVRAGLLDSCGDLAFLDATVEAISRSFDSCEPGALFGIKSYLDTLAGTPPSEAEQLSVSVSRQAFESPAAAEGRRAFRARCPPPWAG